MFRNMPVPQGLPPGLILSHFDACAVLESPSRTPRGNMKHRRPFRTASLPATTRDVCRTLGHLKPVIKLLSRGQLRHPCRGIGQAITHSMRSESLLAGPDAYSRDSGSSIQHNANGKEAPKRSNLSLEPLSCQSQLDLQVFT